MTKPTTKKVIATEGRYDGMIIGYVHEVVSFGEHQGWGFNPLYQAGQSRKAWPTPEAALKGRVKNYRLED